LKTLPTSRRFCDDDSSVLADLSRLQNLIAINASAIADWRKELMKVR